MQQPEARQDPAAWITRRPIAHRGLHDLQAGAPENSLAAFARAVEAKLPIELDVRLLADGRVAVFHDADLRRLTGDARKIADCTAEQIRPLRLVGTDEPIPLLEDVLRLVAGRVGVLVEIKNDTDDRRCEQAVGALLTGYDGPVAVQSFNADSMGWFRQHMPQIVRGQIASDSRSAETLADPLTRRKIARRHEEMCRVGEPHFFAYDARCLSAWAPTDPKIARLPLIAWTVRSPAEQAAAMKYADNVIFEGFSPAMPETPCSSGG